MMNIKFPTLKTDNYTLKARVVPAVLCAVPAVCLILFARSCEAVGVVVSEAWSWTRMSLAQTALVASAIFYIAALGKRYEDRIFKHGLHFPATEKLLWSNRSTPEWLKEKVREKLHEDFGISLLSRECELVDEHAARVAIRDAVSQISQSVGNGTRVLDRSVRYGFLRNFAAAAKISLVLSIVGVVVSASMRSLGWRAFFLEMAVFYGLALLPCRHTIQNEAEHYAEVLLNEYAAKEGRKIRHA